MDKKFALLFQFDSGRIYHYQARFDPGNPATRCTILFQFSPFEKENNTGLLQSVGLGVRKRGDAYNLETGCRMALKSALRGINEKGARAAAWRSYFEKFPLERRPKKLILGLMQARKAAVKLIAEKIMLRNAWPEDEWHRLSENWDLNVYLNGEGDKRATLYPVLSGKTITTEWYSVHGPWEDEPLEISALPRGCSKAAMERCVREMPDLSGPEPELS